MEVHQVLVSVSPGDAITNHAFELRALLRRVTRSNLYAYYVHPELADEVLPLHSFHSESRNLGADVLLFHASIGAPEVFSFICDRPERLVVNYHNISPASYFYDHDPAFAGLLDGGRRELAALRDRTEMALCDSQFNADELLELGYRDVRVSPLIIDVGRLTELQPDRATVEELAEAPGAVHLFVGQLLPHKRPDLLVRAFHALATYLEPDARLYLVGAGRLPAYRWSLEVFLAELGLHNVVVTGSVSDERLVAFYRGATSYVTASEHEGFCIPLLEAMAFGVPVVARDHAAVPDTLGGAGLLLPAGAGPLMIAEALHSVGSDDRLRRHLIARGARRLAAFDADRARTQFLANLADVA